MNANAEKQSATIARDVGRAVARAIRQNRLDRTSANVERLRDALLHLAIEFSANGDNSVEILRVARRLGEVKLPL